MIFDGGRFCLCECFAGGWNALLARFIFFFRGGLLLVSW
jgi:hypothetical protein